MENLHLRFQKARKTLISKQEDLGKKIGISQTDISYIENGKAKKINPLYLYYLLSNGISWKYLFEGVQPMVLSDYSNNEELRKVNESKIEYFNNKDKSELTKDSELLLANKKIEYLERLIDNSVKLIIDRIEFKN